MPDVIVDCPLNFSNGQHPDIIEAIAQAARRPGVQVLDISSDPDHNRSVITFAGTPEATQESAFAVVARAIELIDLRHHRGTHPRIGAVDVVPFVPVRGGSMAECVQMARRTGERIGRELGVPVYLYEQAA